MPEQRGYEAANRQVCLRAGVPALLTWGLIPLSFLLSPVDSTRAPYFGLTGIFSRLAYRVSQSGGKFGIPIVGAAMLMLLIARGGIAFQRRWKEARVILLIAAACGGCGAALNEHLLKEELKIPRPNIVWLAGEGGSGPLGMTPEDFYASGGKEARRDLLSQALGGVPEPFPLSPSIEAHWIEETGYSFPSGHAFSAMFFAVFFLMLAATYVRTNRLWMFYPLLPWALAVCWSRSILRVHTPADITAGGLLGLAVGLAAWAAARKLIRRPTHWLKR